MLAACKTLARALRSGDRGALGRSGAVVNVLAISLTPSLRLWGCPRHRCDRLA